MKRFASFGPSTRNFQALIWTLATSFGLLAFSLAAMDSQTAAAFAPGAGETAIDSSPPEAALANPNVLYVTADGTGTQCSIAQPCYLHTAVDQAANGYEIRAAAGLYDQEHAVGGVTNLPTLYINKSLTILGGFTTTNWTDFNPEVNVTILDGQNTRRVVWLQSGIGSLEGFTVRNGLINEDNGGGIYVDANATQVVAFNRIHDNDSTTVNVNGVTTGGGVEILGQATVLANQIYNNTASLGGGVFSRSGGTINLISNVIYDNSATFNPSGGGGVGSQSTGTLNIWHNTIVSNQAAASTTGGGGIGLFDGTVTVYNNIIANNTAAGGDAGLVIDTSFGGNPTVTGSHNNLFNNTTNVTLTDPISGDPLFVNAAADDYRIQDTSPSQDAATAAFSSDIDFERQPRPFNGVADAGADEYYPAGATCFARVNDGTGDGEVFVDLQTAVDQAQTGDLIKIAGVCTGTGTEIVTIDEEVTLQGGYQLTNWLPSERGQVPTLLDGENSRRLIVITAGSPTVDSLRLTNGNATTGAAVHVTGSSPQIYNNVVFNNTATSGGAIAGETGTAPSVEFNTIVDNSGDGVNLAANGTVQNNIIYDNTGTPTSGGLITAFNLIGVDPLFVDAPGGDYRITSTSPALDFGDPNATLNSDFEGDPRPRGQRPDAGADEANSYPSVRFNPASSTIDIERGTTLNVPLDLINDGTLAGNWDIIVQQVQGWSLSFPAQISNLAAGAQVDLGVVVTAPVGATPLTPETLTFTATSQLNTNAQAVATVQLNVIPIRGVTVTPVYSETLLPGEVITFEHTIENTGEFTDTFRVQILDDPFGWGTLFTADLIEESDGQYDVVIASGETTQSFVRIDVPEFAPAGFANELLLQAYSLAEPAVQDTVTDTVTAKATVGTRYVSTQGNDTDNNCRVATNPCRTVARGVSQASTGDEVHIAVGNYQETVEMAINTTLSVRGGWDNLFTEQSEELDEQNGTVISAAGQDRLFNVSGGATNLTMEFVTLRDGNRTSGGAIFLRNGAQATLSSIAFLDNQATRGGAVYMEAGTTATITGSRFRRNQSVTDGGAIYSEGTLNSFNNLFESNLAGDEGGAIYASSPAAVAFWHNTAHDNEAQTGGVVYQAGGTLIARNNNFTSNSAPQSSAIHSAAGSYDADHNNFWNNSTPVRNQPAGANSTTLDPLYTDNLYRLAPTSLLLDIGDPNAPVDDDFEGNPRPSDQGFDLGWYELAGCRAQRDSTIYFSIQEALEAGGSNLIQVSGICRGVNTFVADGTPVSQTVYITESVTIQGGWNADFDNDVTEDPVETFINPQGLGRGIYIGDGASPTIESIAIISGTAEGLGGGPADEDAGGGIYVASGAPTFSQVGIYSSTATIGGGFYNHEGAPVFTIIGDHETVLENTGEVRVSDLAYNQATIGGALYSYSGTLTLSHAFVRWNDAVTGAGVYLDTDTAATLVNNVLYQNVASGDGGGLYNSASNAQIWHQTFYQNEAANGGAFYNAGSSATLHNNIFQENTAATSGPAIFHNATGPDFDYNYYHAHTGAPVTGTSLGANSLDSATPPGLLAPGLGDFRLESTSAAIDIGDPATPFLVDFEDDLRPSNQGFDLGADELAGCYARVDGIIYGSPQVALQNADTGDQIDVAGLCLGVNTVNTGGPLGTISQTVYISKSVTFLGGWRDDFSQQDAVTTFDALGLGRVVYIAPGITATLQNIDLRGGDATIAGGNGHGGGVYVDQADATLEMLNIFENNATHGGGIYIANASAVVQMGNRISENTAVNGGAIYVNNSTGIAQIHNNFVFSNTVTNNGGGFYNEAGNNLWRHNTLHANAAVNNGGGIYIAAASPQVRSSIFVSNTATTGSGAFGQTGSSPVVGYNDFFGNSVGGTVAAGTGDLAVDPGFTNITAGDYTISLGSPVANAGDPNSTVSEDYEGDVRPSQQYHDMGADEVGDCYARIVGQGQIYYSAQVAIDAAQAGDTVEIDGLCMGVNQQTINAVPSTQALYIDKDIILDGSWDSGLTDRIITVIDAEGKGRVLYVAPGVTAEVRSLHLINGDANSAGFAAGLGGGVYNAGALTLSQSQLRNNAGTDGAGFYQAGSGLVERSSFNNNIATGNGGAIYIDGTTDVQNNFMFDNQAVNGAGIYRTDATANIWHNTLVANTATSNLGAGIFVETNSGTIGSNIVDANIGSGIHALLAGGNIRYNNVVANTNGNYSGQAADVQGGISAVPTYVGGSDFHLLDGSAGIDVGDPNSPIVDDIDGDIRPINLGFDIGADEVGSCLIRVVGDGSTPTQDFGVLQDAIDYAEANGLTELLVARGECTGVRERNGQTQLGYINSDLNFYGSRARPDFAQTDDYNMDGLYTPSTLFNATSDGRVLYIAPGANPTFENIAFIGGQALGENGGIIYNAGNSAFTDIAMCEGIAENGGILYNAPAGTVDVSGTTVRLGSCIVRIIVEADDGTEISNEILPLEGGGFATQNGGVVYNDGSMQLGGVGVYDGLAQVGGGVYNNGQLDIRNALIRTNEALFGDGGGLYNTPNALNSQFTNVGFYDNAASGNGGGMYHSDGVTLLLHHGTFNQNSASEGGGLYNLEDDFTINSTIFYGNEATTGNNGAIQSVNHVTNNDVGLDYNNFFANTPQQSSIGFGSNVILEDPLLFGSVLLDVDSPVIDQADPSLVAADPRFEIDLRAEPRPDGGPENAGAEVSPYRSDIGAYEHIKRYACEITPLDPNPVTVVAGSEQLYEIRVLNAGQDTAYGRMGYRDRITVRLESTSQGWGTLVGGDVQTVELDFFEDANFTVSVQTPLTALVDETETTVISCESATTGAKIQSSYVTVIAESPGVVIEPDHPQITRKPGDVITYTHVITNVGNGADTFELIASPGPNFANAVFVDESGVPLTPAELTFPLNVGEDISFTLQVTVLDTAPQGGIATPGAVVRSTTDPTVTDAAQNPILIDFTTGTRYVAQGDTADINNNCTLAINPCATMQHAVDQASAGDSVHVSTGVYTNVVTATINSEVVTQTLLINKPITIVGGFDSSDLFTQFQPITNAVRIDGDEDWRAVYVTDGITATLEGVFISNGFNDLAGGGIFNQGADLSLKGVVVVSNTATFGSGIYHESGRLFVNSSVFFENNNLSGLEGNGAGMYINGGDLVLENNTFRSNRTIFISSDVPPIGTAGGYGGGFYQEGGSLTLLNNIFSSNQANNYPDSGGDPTSAYFVTSTVNVIDRGYNIYDANEANLPLLATEIVTDPQFVDIDDFDLPAGSPAIDAGTSAVFTGLDIDGQPRRMGVAIDIGADEFFQEPNFLFLPENLTATIDSGAVHTYTFTLTNTGEFTDDYTIDRLSTPNGGTGWGYEVIPTAVNSLPVGEAVTVTLTITGGSPGFVDVTNLTAASVTDPNLTRVVTATTTISQTAGVLLEPPRSGGTEPDSTITYTHTLTNTGNGPDSFDLTVTGQTAPWSVTVVPTTTAQLLPNESTPVTVTVTPPADALSGTVHVAEITAVSVVDPAISDTVTDTTTILPVFGLIIDPTAAGYTVPDGQTAVYTHTLTSQSNVTDTVTVDVFGAGPAWLVGTSTPSVELVPFGSAVISVSVNVPAGSTGLVHTMTVRATSAFSTEVQATAINTTTVQTVRSVTLEPSQAISTTAGQTAVFAHTLTNSGNVTDSFTLSANSSQGWTFTIDPLTSGSLAAGESIPVTVSVTVPPGTPVGTVDVTTVTATSTNVVTVTDSAADTTTVITQTAPILGVEIDPDNATTVTAGQTIFYYHTVTNTGSNPATIDLDVSSSEGWTAVLDNVSLNLAASEAVQVEVSLTVPGGATVGTVDITVVTATNSADAMVFDTAVNTTTITDTAVVQLALTPTANAQDGAPGEMVTYTHTLINQGNQVDTISLEAVSDNGWTVTVDPRRATLGAGQQAPVVVTVQIPAAAAGGSTDRTTVTATSGNDSSEQATAVNTTTVVEAGTLIYLPVIRQSSGGVNPPPSPTPTATPVTHIPTCIRPQYGQMAGVDLVVVSAEVIPNNPTVGQSVTVRLSIRNQGETDVTFGNNFYLDAYYNNVPDPKEQGPVFWGIQGRDLGAGETRTYSAQTSFSQSGEYWIYAQVDTDEVVDESNESNNRLGGCAEHAFTVTGTSLSADGTPTPVPDGPRPTPTSAAPVVTPTAVNTPAPTSVSEDE